MLGMDKCTTDHVYVVLSFLKKMFLIEYQTCLIYRSSAMTIRHDDDYWSPDDVTFCVVHVMPLTTNLCHTGLLCILL